MNPKLLTAKAAQKYIGISVAVWRNLETYPVSTTLGERKLYHTDDLDRWLNERRDSLDTSTTAKG